MSGGPRYKRLLPVSTNPPTVCEQDGEIAVIGSDGCSLDMSRMEKSPHQEDILLSPSPYPHWTLRECLQQPEAIARALAFGGEPSPEDEAFLVGKPGREFYATP